MDQKGERPANTIPNWADEQAPVFKIVDTLS
jgi:hypothetical protein